MTTTSHPECEKLAEIHDERVAINEFVAWAGGRLHGAGEIKTDELVLEFYGIDRDRLEVERQAMLAGLRGAQ